MRASVQVVHDAFSGGRTLSSIPVLVPRTIPKPCHPLGPHPINLRHLTHLRDPPDILIRHRLDPDEPKRARVARALLKAGREPHVAVKWVRDGVRRRADGVHEDRACERPGAARAPGGERVCERPEGEAGEDGEKGGGDVEDLEGFGSGHVSWWRSAMTRHKLFYTEWWLHDE